MPDILTLAKSAAGGLPIGITAFGDAVRNLTALSHTTTFGGNPLVCAVADRVIAYLVSAGIPQRAAEQGDYFLGRLRQLDNRLIRDVRGLGLMIGVELKRPAAPYARRLMDHGVLALMAGTTVLVFLPPLIITPPKSTMWWRPWPGCSREPEHAGHCVAARLMRHLLAFWL